MSAAESEEPCWNSQLPDHAQHIVHDSLEVGWQTSYILQEAIGIVLNYI